MDNKINFVASAIQDIQSTIRAVDVKVAALLVGILAPLGNVNRIFAHLEHFGLQSPKWFFLTVAVFFVLAWLLALVALARAIGAIDNPAEHIINVESCRGTFYAGGLYRLGFLDVFLNRDIIKASRDPQTFSAQLPDNSADIERELVFEQMKLVYIRDMKMKRLLWGLRFSFLWLVLGIGIYLSSKYLLG